MAKKDASGLTIQQSAYVDALVAGNTKMASFLIAGYLGGEVQSEKFHRQAMRNPEIAMALHAAVASRLNTDVAPRALQIALDLLENPAVSEKTRADLAIKLLQLAGHVAPRANVVADMSGRSLAELSREDLLARCDSIEAELARRATPVSAMLAPSNAQALDSVEQSAPR